MERGWPTAQAEPEGTGRLGEACSLAWSCEERSLQGRSRQRWTEADPGHFSRLQSGRYHRETLCPLGALPGRELGSAGNTPGRGCAQPEAGQEGSQLRRQVAPLMGQGWEGGPLGAWLPPGEQRTSDKKPGPMEAECSTRSD